jgi:hypothetical protein
MPPSTAGKMPAATGWSYRDTLPYRVFLARASATDRGCLPRPARHERGEGWEEGAALGIALRTPLSLTPSRNRMLATFDVEVLTDLNGWLSCAACFRPNITHHCSCWVHEARFPVLPTIYAFS